MRDWVVIVGWQNIYTRILNININFIYIVHLIHLAIVAENAHNGEEVAGTLVIVFGRLRVTRALQELGPPFEQFPGMVE
jgi:hypothetical protein